MGEALDRYAEIVQQREEVFISLVQKQRRERSFLLRVFDALPEGVVVQDLDGEISFANERARAMLDVVQGQTQAIRTRIPQGMKVVAQAKPGITLAGGATQVYEGGRFLQMQPASLTGQDLQPLGFVILIRDVTDEVRRQQQVEALLMRLSEDEQDLTGQMTLPVQVVTGQTQRDVWMPSRVAISRHATTLQQMIEDMRALTIQPPDSRTQMQIVDVETLIWSIINDWRQIAHAASIEIQATMGSEAVAVLGDEAKLRFAIGHIVDNAIQYNTDGGRVSIEVNTITDTLVRLRIRDTGTGIQAHDYENIFAPFYRGTPLLANGSIIQTPGMGRGLTIARQIVTSHGGAIEVRTQQYVGTAVMIELPRVAHETLNLSPGQMQFAQDETVTMSPHGQLR